MSGLSIVRWLVVGNSGQSFRRVFDTIQAQRYLAVLTERLRWSTDGDLSGPGASIDPSVGSTSGRDKLFRVVFPNWIKWALKPIFRDILLY